jgi:formylglycine-generating enzyme required for sulfatase activity
MRRWFLSYNSQDLGLMETLERALRRKDPEAKVFFAPKSLRVGGLWLPELAREIADATAFLLLVGEKGIGPWQAMEYYEAIDRRVKQHDFPVVLLLLDGQPAPGLPFLRQLHWVITADPKSEKSLALVMEAAAGGGAPPGELWRHTAPYRGLYAMTESDADYFFGRGRETAEVIEVLAATPDKLPTLLGNSGVGKSSLAQAGVLAALMRQAWPETAEAPGAWPQAFNESRRWCFLRLKPGTEPVRALVEPFLWTWQFDAVDPRRAELLSSWVSKLIDGKVTLRDLLDATEARYRDELHQPKPPAFLLYIDQGEELYVRAEERQRRCFSEIVACGLSDPRLHATMSMRADFFGDLQKDEALHAVHRLIEVPPLREAQLREVVSRPAELLSARFETNDLAASIAHRTWEGSAKDAGALPLLSYLLDDMWAAMVARGDGVLRLPAQAIELGAVLVDRADAFLAAHPKSQDELRRIFTLKLATVREGEEPTRRRALRSEFTDEEWRLVSELADHPNRLLVTATPEEGATYAEVAHEAIFRRWGKLHDWIVAEREFLAWRTGLEAARRAWQATPEGLKNDALLIGATLTQAQSWLGKRSDDIPEVDRDFIALSRKAAQRRRLRARTLIGVLVFAIVAGLPVLMAGGWIVFQLVRLLPQFWDVSTSALTTEAEQALKPGGTFKECASCPEMIVVPAGEFVMGSPATESGRYHNEGPQHKVTIARPFAVGRFEITLDEWDACGAHGECRRGLLVGGLPTLGRRPVFLLTWHETKQYVAWIAKLTGKPYRLLSEAEWEYAARAGSPERFSFGDDEAKLSEYAWYFSGEPKLLPEPVGMKKDNSFGLHDMHGNVREWVEDCYHDDYNGAPSDGSAWTTGDCSRRVGRSSYWLENPQVLRSAFRMGYNIGNRYQFLGLRVGRTLAP